MSSSHLKSGLLTLAVVGTAAILAGVLGCSSEDVSPSSPSRDILATNAGRGGSPTVAQGLASNHEAPPSGLVSVDFLGETLGFWPYTGRDFSGETVDPVNLIFLGEADPRQIRAALMSLDGDRTMFGYPPDPPFNMTWEDAIGDVQTCFADDGGWEGSVIQLQLGDYSPLRFHLRLFQTDTLFGQEGTWTIGAAHFEALIDGTPNHQVLSWEKAAEIVIADMLRSQLLDGDIPMMPTQVITQTPSYRYIPEFIYNNLPNPLIEYLAGPPKPVTEPVPLPNDGTAMMLNLASAVPVTPGTWTTDFTIDFQQMVPKPFCSTGPEDWVYITGPIYLTLTSEIDADGNYDYYSKAKGHLEAVPMDITQDPPMPIGEPFQANIGDNQSGLLYDNQNRVQFQTKRVAPQDGGAEMLMTRLVVSSRGGSGYRESSKCLSP